MKSRDSMLEAFFNIAGCLSAVISPIFSSPPDHLKISPKKKVELPESSQIVDIDSQPVLPQKWIMNNDVEICVLLGPNIHKSIEHINLQWFLIVYIGVQYAILIYNWLDLLELSEFNKLIAKEKHFEHKENGQNDALKEGKGSSEEIVEASDSVNDCEKAPDPRGVIDEQIVESNDLPKQVISEETQSTPVQSSSESLDINQLIEQKVWSRYQSKAKKLVSALSRTNKVSYDSAGILYYDGSPKAGLNILGISKV